MKDKIVKNLKLIVVIVIIAFLGWFFVISPSITFKSNEQRMVEAAKRYYELNSSKLPTGERVGTVYLSTLYHESYLSEDIFIPHTKNTCSISNSWVKVKRENGEFKYYTYLECGLMKSSIDHVGPQIKLNGDTEIEIGYGEEYKESGVKSVVDKKDGKIDVKNVEIKGKVDTSRMGTYEIKYTAFDSLKNKTTVTRTITVVQRLNSTIKKVLGDSKYYVGENPDNIIYFSNNMFRIIGLDNNDNVKIVAVDDVGNVDYNSIDKWLEYYENHLTDSAKKLIVKAEYCEMSIDNSKFNIKECSDYSKKKKIGLVSIDDVNNTKDEEGKSYLIPSTISWLSNQKNKNKVYAVRDTFSGSKYTFMSFKKSYNYGVRPVITIKGDTLITSGVGSYNDSYYLSDFVSASKHDLLNTRFSGEYISYGGYLWRIIDVMDDGTTKVILDQSLFDENVNQLFLNYESDKIYNPTKKGNLGYKINNLTSKYVESKYFVNHEFTVPIYKKIPSYGGEVSSKKYTAKFIAPDLYDLYTSRTYGYFGKSYSLLNSSKDELQYNGISDTGVFMHGSESTFYDFGVRPVGFLNKKCFITSGKGTEISPFVISK